jgi:hypothetical protein
MSDNEEREEQEPKQITTKDSVRILLKAFELAGIAERYESTQEIQSRDTRIYINNGSEMREDPTLAHYIAIAEKKYIEKYSDSILDDARQMLEIEIDEIRRLVND